MKTVIKIVLLVLIQKPERYHVFGNVINLISAYGEKMTEPLSNRVVIRRRGAYDSGCQVLEIEAEGMSKFQLDDATTELTISRIIMEVLRWVEGTHVPSITFVCDRIVKLKNPETFPEIT